MDASWTDAAVLVAQLAMGISLAACAGLRAFLPMLVVAGESGTESYKGDPAQAKTRFRL